MATIIAVAGRKGGAGKTTFAATLAATSVSKLFHTGTVDLDSQGNLSLWALGRDAATGLGALQTVAALEFPPSELLRADYPELAAVATRSELVDVVSKSCIHKSECVAGLSVVPVTPRIHPENIRDVVLAALPFDVVIVDCPPDVSTHAVRSVLRQADAVISPVVCEPWAVDATEQLAVEIVSCKREDLLDSGALRFVVNMRQKTSMSDKLEKALRARWGKLVSPVVVPRSVAIAEASLSPSLLTKKHPLWKVGMSLWSEVERTQKKRGAA